MRKTQPSGRTQLLELNVGDSFQVGNQLFTVIDIDGPDVSFRIEGTEVFAGSETQTLALPLEPR